MPVALLLQVQGVVNTYLTLADRADIQEGRDSLCGCSM